MPALNWPLSVPCCSPNRRLRSTSERRRMAPRASTRRMATWLLPAAVLAQDHGALNRIRFLAEAEQADFAAHHGAVGLVEIQQFQRGVVAGAFQPGADKTAGERLEAAVFQVHGEEGGVRSDVDQAEGFVEFDAVEQHDLTVEQGDVAQMNIAMAFTDEAFGLASGQQWLEPGETAFSPGLQGIELLQVGLVREQWTDLLEILPDWRHDRLRRAQLMGQGHLRRVEMELGDLFGQGVDMRFAQLAACLHFGEQLILRKLAHFQGVLDDRAITAQLRGFGATADRQNCQVQALSEALVEAQLFLAEVFARGQFGEVEEAEIHRFLDLVGIGTGQHYPGDMRLDDLESLYRMGV